MAKIVMVAVTVFNSETAEEYQIDLPHTREVCDRCDGHGTHLNPSIGEHAYTPEEFNDSFDDEEREQYFKRGGIYDVTCHCCKGAKVINVLCQDECKTDDQKEALRFIREAEAWAEYDRRESEAERRMGC
jgi:hypothetical protein